MPEKRVLVRLAVVGVTWFSALGLFAGLIQWSAPTPPALSQGRDGVTGLARDLNQLRPTTAATHQWTVTKATSALGALVIEVDAVNPASAMQIARTIVEGSGGKYDEILVYVHALDPSRDPTVRRVEWTPTRGYTVSSF